MLRWPYGFLTGLGSVWALWFCVVSAGRAGTSGQAYGNDFTVFYVAARSWWQTGDPYHHALAETWPYLYPPLFAQLLTPLTFLSLPQAAFLWAAGNVACTILLFEFCRRCLFSDWSAVRLELCGAVLWCLCLQRLVTGNISLGQVNLWVTFLVTAAAMWEPLSHRTKWAGLALALAISIKLTPAVFLFYFFAKRAWRMVGWTVLWGLVLNLVSLAALGVRRFELLEEWFSTVVVHGWKFNWATASNQSLRGACERWLAHGVTDLPGFPDVTVISLPAQALWVWRGLVACLMGGMMFLAWKEGRDPAPSRFPGRAFAAAACTCVLVSQLSWEIHFVMLAFPVAWVVRDMLNRKPARQTAFAFALLLLTALVLGTGKYLFSQTIQAALAAYSLVTVITLGYFFYFFFLKDSPHYE
ncbi:MAG: DUF2029 domain-containing protein [Blastocatellia bacterium]|nr:DUF2029 domain-containing protein [Blastocatellia bacterium]